MIPGSGVGGEQNKGQAGLDVSKNFHLTNVYNFAFSKTDH